MYCTSPQLGDKHSLLTGEQSATCCSCISPIKPLQLIDSLAKEIGAPVTHASQPLTYLPARVTVKYVAFHSAPAPPDFKFQVFKTLHIARWPLSTVWLQSTCILGLQKTTKGRREEYKKGGEHSRQLVNLILCELL